MKRSRETGSGTASTGVSRKKEKRKGSAISNVNDEEEDTATTEGKMMAQALSTFLPSEQMRFEAFRRSKFRADAVSTFVSSCLMDASSRQYAQREKTRHYLGAAGYGVQHSQPSSSSSQQQQSSASTTSVASITRKTLALGSDPVAMYHNRTRQEGGSEEQLLGKERRGGSKPPDLKDIVAPNTSQEITLVVSTLAKMYAQKLIKSARALSTVEGYHHDAKLLPRHLQEAHRHRVRAGMDPGFFMQSTAKSTAGAGNGIGNCGSMGGSGSGSHTASSAAALGVVDKYSRTLEVARAAQEAYDKSVGSHEDLEGKETKELS